MADDSSSPSAIIDNEHQHQHQPNMPNSNLNNQPTPALNEPPNSSSRIGIHPDSSTILPTQVEINNGEKLNNKNSITISLLKPSSLEAAFNLKNDQLVKVNFPKTTVLQLKSHISTTWSGKPRLNAIRLIARGRILNDSESIGEALTKIPGDHLSHPVHVVIRPNAWTEKLPGIAPPRPLSAPPTAAGPQSRPNPASSPLLPASIAQSLPPSNPMPPNITNTTANNTQPQAAQPTFSPYQLLVPHYSPLHRDQRLAFLDNLRRAQSSLVEHLAVLRHQLYRARIEALGLQLASPESDLVREANQQEDHTWKTVEEQLTKLLSELQFLGDYDSFDEPVEFAEYRTRCQEFEAPCEFERVEISGLPFLLYVPQSLQGRKSSLAPMDGSLLETKRLKKELAKTLYLETRLDQLIMDTRKLEANVSRFESRVGHGTFSQHFLGAGTAPGAAAMRIPNMLNGPVAAEFGAPNNALGPAAGGGLGFGLGLGLAADGLLPLPNNLGLPPGPLFQHPPPRVRRYEFTINLDRIRRYMAPLTWLSLKLAVLLYIFGRHASANKLAILVAIAVGWVVWEAYSIGQRLEAQTRRRERVQRVQGGAVDPIQAVLDRGRRRAERERQQRMLREHRQRADARAPPPQQAAPAPPPAPVPAPAPAPAPALAGAEPGLRRRNLRTAAADIRARGGAFPPGTEVRPFRATSALSPKYWFNSIAVVGLASEYRELGLHPVGERRLGASHAEYPRWYRYLRNVKTCVVLFVGTLLPEIEKKRRKALEKRSRILNLVIADAARDRGQGQEGPRAVEGGGGADSEGTPRAVRATGVEVGGDEDGAGVARRRQVSGDGALAAGTASAATPRPSSSNSALLGTAESSVPSTLNTSPTPAGNQAAAAGLEQPQEQPAQADPGAESSNGPNTNNNNNALDSPLTPVNERHVVGGLDDTDDDDEVAGAGEEEAGMVLF